LDCRASSSALVSQQTLSRGPRHTRIAVLSPFEEKPGRLLHRRASAYFEPGCYVVGGESPEFLGLHHFDFVAAATVHKALGSGKFAFSADVDDEVLPSCLQPRCEAHSDFVYSKWVRVERTPRTNFYEACGSSAAGMYARICAQPVGRARVLMVVSREPSRRDMSTGVIEQARSGLCGRRLHRQPRDGPIRRKRVAAR